MKLWQGRTAAQLNMAADDFNSSISFDSRMYAQDIKGSMAHAAMLAKQGIITDSEADAIIAGLEGILKDINSGALTIDPAAEDIHMFVEEVLTKRIGNAGKKLHTARSRNDQVTLDTRMYLKDAASEIEAETKKLISAVADTAEKHKEDIMPGYTHLQRAQPILFSHQLLAYAFMLLRDLGRMEDCVKRMNVSPIGACALAGTTYNTDRQFEAKQLGFDAVIQNSIDAVSDRDYVAEMLSAISLEMMHLSRLSEELILWTSWEFGFVTLSDEYTTGSSIMPQKKNSDMAELIRGKTGRVYGDLMGTLTMLKGLPLAYNKDMQEDKESIFDAVDTVKMCLPVMTGMIKTMSVNADKMLQAAKKGFINATDLADYLTKKDVPFRDAYKISGSIVADCIAKGLVLEELSVADYKQYSEVFGGDVYDAIDLKNCIRLRLSEGSTSYYSVEKQIELIRRTIK